MPAGSVLGLTAKLGLETDDRQVEQETNSLKDKINEAANAEMEADVDTLKQDIINGIEDAVNEAEWAPDSLQSGIIGAVGGSAASSTSFSKQEKADFRSRMEGIGQKPGGDLQMGRPSGGKGGDSGLMDEALGGMKGAGGKFLKVGLAGTVGLGILSKVGGLADSSPRMMKILDQVSRSIQLFARPFFDYLAKFLQGDIGALLGYAANFNEWYNEGNLPVAIVKSAEDVITKGGDAGPLESVGRAAGGLAGAAGGAYAGGKAGMMAGGAIGSVVPVGGTAAGAAIGGVGGALAGGILGLKGGGALGSMGDDLVSWLQDKWPGWPDLGDLWPGWLQNSPGVIPTFPGWGDVLDAFPGWGTWIDPIAWNVPGGNAVQSSIQAKIPELRWNVPSIGDVNTWIRDKIPNLRWNVPSVGDMQSWVTNKIPGLDWNIPSISDVNGWIRDAIPDIGWPDVSKNDIINAVDPNVDWNPSNNNGNSGGDGNSGLDYLDPRGSPLDPREHMASGGLVTSPTNALVGESGPEIVAPFNQFMNAMNSPERRFGTSASQPSMSGGSDADLDDVISELNSLKKEMKRSSSGDVYLDNKRVGEVQRKGDERYRKSRVVTK